VKSNVFVSRKIKRLKDASFSSLNVDLCYFCEIEFSSPLAPNELMLDFLRDHVYWAVSGKHVNVLNLIEMFLMVTLVTKISTQTSESQGVDEILNLQSGEVQH
jgi:hypothetical protein